VGNLGQVAQAVDDHLPSIKSRALEMLRVSSKVRSRKSFEHVAHQAVGVELPAGAVGRIRVLRLVPSSSPPAFCVHRIRRQGEETYNSELGRFTPTAWWATCSRLLRRLTFDETLEHSRHGDLIEGNGITAWATDQVSPHLPQRGTAHPGQQGRSFRDASPIPAKTKR